MMDQRFIDTDSDDQDQMSSEKVTTERDPEIEIKGDFEWKKKLDARMIENVATLKEKNAGKDITSS
jgi:hypothetical protein